MTTHRVAIVLSIDEIIQLALNVLGSSLVLKVLLYQSLVAVNICRNLLIECGWMVLLMRMEHSLRLSLLRDLLLTLEKLKLLENCLVLIRLVELILLLRLLILEILR